MHPVLVLVCVTFFTVFWFEASKFLVHRFWRPIVLAKTMHLQGIKGPPRPGIFTPTLPDMPDVKQIDHDILSRVIPLHVQRFRDYGPVCMTLHPAEPRLELFHIELMKKVLIKKPQHLGKSLVFARLGDDIFKGGVFDASGQDWLRQKQVIAPTFHGEKIKGMVKTMYTCTQNRLNHWDSLVKLREGEVKLDVYPEFIELTTDIIGETAFGASHSTSSEIMNRVRLLLALQSGQVRYAWMFDLIRLLPTPTNIKRWKLRRELHSLLQKEIDERRTLKKTNGVTSHGDDFLGVLLNTDWNDEVVKAQCKTIYATGHATLSAFYSWAMLLLAMNPEWQEKARDEVRQLVKHVGPLESYEALNKLKLVEMIIRETMRLYPPMPLIPRVALEDCYVGELFIPKGLGVSIFPFMAHHSEELWGEDVHEFKPERFSKGSAAASGHPMGFMPFSFGWRTCIGQAYAQVQTKLVLAMLLLRFEWELAPEYRHTPSIAGPLFPKHGLPLLLKIAQDN